MLPSGYQLIQRANDEIKWETTTQTNVGIDYGFFDHKLYGVWNGISKTQKIFWLNLLILALLVKVVIIG